MRSVAKLRQPVEVVARLLALGLLVCALWIVVRQSAAPLQVRELPASDVESEVPALIRAGASQLTVRMDRVPSRVMRDVLRALARSGYAVAWLSETPDALALSVEPIAGPDARSRVIVMGNVPDPITLVDAGGILDSTTAPGSSRAVIGSVRGTVSARARTTSAHVRSVAADAPKPVLVLGRVGWEAKFVIAALEEAGWRVAGELLVTPARPAIGVAPVVVRTAETGPPQLDTARFSAVVALDGSAFGYAERIRAFVVQGGGAILGAEAIRDVPGLSSISPGRAGDARTVLIGALSSRPPRDGLTGWTLQPSTDAVPVEYNRGELMVVAMREGLGRIVAIGYGDTWRWRMEGGDGAVDDHRRWWSDLVASVTPVRVSVPSVAEVAHDPAPLATWVHTFGAPARTALPALSQVRVIPWLVVVAALLLLAEWTSRRLRGAR